MEFYVCAHFDQCSHGRAGTTSMGVKGMMMDRRELNSCRWRSGFIVIHYATAATSQQLKTCDTIRLYSKLIQINYRIRQVGRCVCIFLIIISIFGLMVNNSAFGIVIDNMQNLFTYTNVHNLLFFCQHASLALLCATVSPLAVI